jgi:hypothetical protein
MAKFKLNKFIKKYKLILIVLSIIVLYFVGSYPNSLFSAQGIAGAKYADKYSSSSQPNELFQAYESGIIAHMSFFEWVKYRLAKIQSVAFTAAGEQLECWVNPAHVEVVPFNSLETVTLCSTGVCYTDALINLFKRNCDGCTDGFYEEVRLSDSGQTSLAVWPRDSTGATTYDIEYQYYPCENIPIDCEGTETQCYDEYSYQQCIDGSWSAPISCSSGDKCTLSGECGACEPNWINDGLCGDYPCPSGISADNCQLQYDPRNCDPDNNVRYIACDPIGGGDVCTDSDSINRLIKGTTTKGTASSTDECISDLSVVKEYYCANDEIVSQNLNCFASEECSDGKCVEKTSYPEVTIMNANNGNSNTQFNKQPVIPGATFAMALTSISHTISNAACPSTGAFDSISYSSSGLSFSVKSDLTSIPDFELECTATADSQVVPITIYFKFMSEPTSCSVDSDCDSGEVCQSGNCVASSVECESNDDCTSPKTCVGGYCINPDSSCSDQGGVICPEGQICDGSMVWIDGDYCCKATCVDYENPQNGEFIIIATSYNDDGSAKQSGVIPKINEIDFGQPMDIEVHVKNIGGETGSLNIESGIYTKYNAEKYFGIDVGSPFFSVLGRAGAESIPPCFASEADFVTSIQVQDLKPGNERTYILRPHAPSEGSTLNDGATNWAGENEYIWIVGIYDDCGVGHCNAENYCDVHYETYDFGTILVNENPEPSHTEWFGDTCIRVPGSGTDICDYDMVYADEDPNEPVGATIYCGQPCSGFNDIWGDQSRVDDTCKTGWCFDVPSSSLPNLCEPKGFYVADYDKLSGEAQEAIKSGSKCADQLGFEPVNDPDNIGGTGGEGIEGCPGLIEEGLTGFLKVGYESPECPSASCNVEIQLIKTSFVSVGDTKVGYQICEKEGVCGPSKTTTVLRDLTCGSLPCSKFADLTTLKQDQSVKIVSIDVTGLDLERYKLNVECFSDDVTKNKFFATLADWFNVSEDEVKIGLGILVLIIGMILIFPALKDAFKPRGKSPWY